MLFVLQILRFYSAFLFYLVASLILRNKAILTGEIVMYWYQSPLTDHEISNTTEQIAMKLTCFFYRLRCSLRKSFETFWIFSVLHIPLKKVTFYNLLL